MKETNTLTNANAHTLSLYSQWNIENIKIVIIVEEEYT
jgi:hypothetical protein